MFLLGALHRCGGRGAAALRATVLHDFSCEQHLIAFCVSPSPTLHCERICWSVWQFKIVELFARCTVFLEMKVTLLCIVSSFYCLSRAFCEATEWQSTTFEVTCWLTLKADALRPWT